MLVEFKRLRLGRQIPTASFVNCTSHQRAALGRLVCAAKIKAESLESGNMPEKPPCAMTSGGLPAKQSHNVSHEAPSIE